MAKSIKNIDEFQKAMLSNTKIIGKEKDVEPKPIKEEKQPAKDEVEETDKEIAEKNQLLVSETKKEESTEKEKPDTSGTVISHKSENSVIINKELFDKYKRLSEYHKLDFKKFIEIGLNFFLKFEEYWFDEALITRSSKK